MGKEQVSVDVSSAIYDGVTHRPHTTQYCMYFKELIISLKKLFFLKKLLWTIFSKHYQNICFRDVGSPI